MNIRDILCAKDTKSSYPLFLQLERQAGEDPALFREYPLYLEKAAICGCGASGCLIEEFTNRLIC